MHFAVPLFGHRLHIALIIISNFSGNSLKLMPPDALICTIKIQNFLGLRPRPHWGSLQRSPRPPSWVEGGASRQARGGEGRGGARCWAVPLFNWFLRHCIHSFIKIFTTPQIPFPGARGGKIYIPLPTNPLWWGSMNAISSYRGNRPTHKHIHCPT